jgi:hypothetical protein
MIISVSADSDNVVLEDNVSGVVKLSSKLSREDFNKQLSELDFAYALRGYAVRYYNSLRLDRKI